MIDTRPGRRPWFRGLQAITVAVVLGLLALLGWRLVDQGKGRELVSAIAADRKPIAPAFDLPVLWNRSETWPPDAIRTLDDGRVSLKELHGRPIVLNFWASWCTPCKAEAPRLASAARTHAGKVLFLGVDVQDFKGDARRFLAKHRANYVSVRDGGGSTYSAYGLTGLPETYYVDKRGRLVAHDVGELSAGDLERGIAQIEGERE